MLHYYFIISFSRPSNDKFSICKQTFAFVKASKKERKKEREKFFNIAAKDTTSFFADATIDCSTQQM